MATSTNSNYTRMDLTPQYGGVAVQCWSGHWQEGDPCDREAFRDGVSLDQALMALEDAGWTVHMFIDRKTGIRTGRALRGDITRVDMRVIGRELVVTFFPYGWQAWTKPISEERWGAEQLEEQVREHELRGWTVHTWKNGARAWKGDPLPVRDAGSILRLRARVEADFRRGETSNERQFNLAFDL